MGQHALRPSSKAMPLLGITMRGPLSEISLFGNKSVQELGIRLKLQLKCFHFSLKLIFCIPTTTMQLHVCHAVK